MNKETSDVIHTICEYAFASCIDSIEFQCLALSDLATQYIRIWSGVSTLSVIVLAAENSRILIFIEDDGLPYVNHEIEFTDRKLIDHSVSGFCAGVALMIKKERSKEMKDEAKYPLTDQMLAEIEKEKELYRRVEDLEIVVSRLIDDVRGSNGDEGTDVRMSVADERYAVEERGHELLKKRREIE